MKWIWKSSSLRRHPLRTALALGVLCVLIISVVQATWLLDHVFFPLGYEWETGKLTRIPSWATETIETEHFVYHYAKADVPVEASLEAQEQHYQWIKQVFSIDLPARIHFVKYPKNVPLPGDVGGLGGKGYVVSHSWFHPHEAVHNYIICRNPFLNEGVAEAFGTTFFYGWENDWSDPIPMMNVTNLKAAMNRWLKVTQQDRLIGCSFIRWLYHRYGAAKLLKMLQQAHFDGRKNFAVISEVYGLPFDDMARRWQEDQKWLSKQPPPEGFFVYAPWDKEVPVPANMPD